MAQLFCQLLGFMAAVFRLNSALCIVSISQLALAARLIPIIVKYCRKKLYIIQNGKDWIPAFAGMTE